MNKLLRTFSLLLSLILASSMSFSQNNFLDFDGNDDYVEINTGGNTLSGTFTVECWASPAQAGGTHSIMSSRFPNNNGFDFKFQNGNQIHGDIGNGSSWLTTSADASLAYVVGQWYHIAYVVTPTGYTIYIDGVLAASGSFFGTPLLYSPNNIITIGAYHLGCCGFPYVEDMDGQIDEFRIWNSARTQSQIQDNMFNELRGNESGLVLYYNFNEGLCGGDNTSLPIPEISDLSANAYNGTMVNSSDGCESNIVCSGACPYASNNVQPFLATPVPTVSEWGIFGLLLIISSIALVALDRKRELGIL